MQKLLIVDDINEYVNALKNALKKQYDVLIASSLNEAQKQDIEAIDIFLIDIRLNENDPDNCDGVRLLDWIKNKYPEKPIIMMSAYNEWDAKCSELLKKGASAFMKKPIFISDLKAKLKELTK